ncbi:HIT family protein [archaeon]|jgi:histidine triad (HIT) family protein|nr:HIT family protein [archaeon]MBT3450446.1 HIT family protein [archaeon]MBT6868997.1 HIT family protein [archaeon]MBT7193263.1 HIT family protein [archaeon]MBT7380118.1 HIT family protein [archaeon]
MNCEYCEIISGNQKANIIYQDDEILAFVKEEVISPGQITVIPIEHLTILEMVPGKILDKMFTVANKLSMAIFETMGCHGTNIFVENGLGGGQTVPHFSLHVIPRYENDNLKLNWVPQQVLPEDLENDFIQIQMNAEGLTISDEIPSEESEDIVVDEGDTEVVLKKQDDENYLLKSLRRRA